MKNRSELREVIMKVIYQVNLYKDSEIERCTAQKGDLLVCEGGDVGRSCIWTYDYPIMHFTLMLV